MPNPSEDTETLASFHQNAPELLRQLKSTHRPITLTVDGKPEAVVLDIADYTEYQRHLDRIDDQEAREGIRRGLEDIAAGRTRPAAEVFAELDREYGIQG